MENKLIINNDDYVFKLVCKDKNKLTETTVFGDENNRLEVNVYNGSYQISSMECIYLDNIAVDKYYLPDYTQINGIIPYKKEFISPVSGSSNTVPGNKRTNLQHS